MPKPAEPSDTRYTIGSVARLTGVSVHTLRVWERRYEAVVAHRSAGGHRLYSAGDVERLRLMKQLADRGDPIGQVARLTTDELHERLRSYAPSRVPDQAESTKPRTVAVMGETLRLQLADGLPGAELVMNHASPELFRADALALKPDVLLLELPTINEAGRRLVSDLMRRSGAQRIIVVYNFARRADVRDLCENFVTVLRAPVTLDELSSAVSAPAAGGVPVAQIPEASQTIELPGDEDLGPIAPRRYTQRQLVTLAMGSSAVECECPTHLADLVRGLSAFEMYSAECESRNADDAALHAHLHSVTARARTLIEGALARVAEIEGIDPGPPAE